MPTPEEYLQLLNNCNERLMAAVEKLDTAVAHRHVPSAVAYTALRTIARTSYDVNKALLTIEMAKDIDASLAMLDGLSTFAETEVNQAISETGRALKAARNKPTRPQSPGELRFSVHSTEEV